MGRLNSSSSLECEVGGVCHVCYFSTPEIEGIINKKGKENLPVNGQIFPYIVHYLTTGDLIYPAHEGENYITSLLEEMGRLDLVRKLFPNQMNGKVSHSGFLRTPDKAKTENDSSAILRIRTREERWVVPKAFARLLRLSKSTDSKTPQVYRPPSQQSKGTTLVVIRSSLHGNNHIRVHGPSTALKSLIPDALTITTQPTHHHLNSQLEPSGSSAHSIVMNLEDQGFVVTVRSSRVEGKTGALITQWLLYRGAGKKLISSSGTSSRRTASLGKAIGSSKKTSRSFSTSRKKLLKSGSTSRCRRPFSFGSDAAKYKTDVAKGEEVKAGSQNNPEVNDSKRRINLNKYLPKSHNSHILVSPSNSQSSTSTISSIASSSKGSSSPSSAPASYSTSSSFSSSSSSSPTNSSQHSHHHNSTTKDKRETIVKEKVWVQKLSSQSLHEQGNLTDSRTNIIEGSMNNALDSPNDNSLSNGHKSFSTSSIAPKPTKKMKASSSLWNICSKSPIKKVLTILL